MKTVYSDIRTSSLERAKRLIRARELAGLTIPQAAKIVGCPRSVLMNLESGCAVVSDSALDHLAKVYGASLPWLLGEDVELPELTERALGEIACPRDREAMRELLQVIRGVRREPAGEGA